MSTVLDVSAKSPTSEITIADLAARFGNMPDHRIRRHPLPGKATERDAIELNERGKVLCELIDGILVEKAVGLYESNLAYLLAQVIGAYLLEHDLGTVFGADGMMRLWPGRIRLPDLSYVSWQRLGGALERAEAALDGGPDLAVEIVSAGNTREEMHEKLADYFTAKVVLVWYVYPKQREVHVFSGIDDVRVLRIGDVLDGGNVLPGFSLPLDQLFRKPGPSSSR